MEKVLKAQWNPKKESEEKVFENITFETAVRGLDILYRSGGGAYELDVCVDGRTVAVAALTGTAGYRDLETVHAEIPPIGPGTHTVSFRTDGNPYVEELLPRNGQRFDYGNGFPRQDASRNRGMRGTEETLCGAFLLDVEKSECQN